MIPKTQVTIEQSDVIKIKNFCASNITIKKMKRQPTEWEKTFANDATNKGLISKIFKHLVQLKRKKKLKNGQKT